MPEQQPVSGAETGVPAFFAQEDRLLRDIAGGSGFSFRRGDQWAINPDTGEATFDTKFFEERGYTPSQALFGALHEIRCHLVETAELLDREGGESAYNRLKQRSKIRERIHIWENCRTDIKGNRAIIEFAPTLTDEVTTVYREKLWPESDLTTHPQHLQFMYAVLRTAMVPDEEVTIDPVVQEAIEKLRNVRGRDVIALATDPHQDPLLALRLSERYIEPVIEELFKKDVENKKEQRKGEGEGEGKGKGIPDDSFSDDYKDYENRHPEPFDEDEMDKRIKETKAGQDAAKREHAGYEEEHRVSAKDIADYRQEYQKIEPYIEPLRAVFRKIIAQRKVSVRHLATLKEEGVMIDPGLVAQTYMDVKAGISNPKTMKDFEGVLVDEQIPTGFEITVVGDRTGSMTIGTKIPEQRRSALLLLEALKEFSDMADQEGSLMPELGVRTEVRSFGANPNRTEILKLLSKELTEQQRIAVFKALATCDSGTNNEQDMFDNLLQSVREEGSRDATYLQRIKSGKLKKFVIVLTDGQVGNYPATRVSLQKLRELGVVVVGVGMTSDGEDAVKTYAPDGKVCYDVGKLPKTMQDLLTDYLGKLSTTGNLQDVHEEKEEV